MAMNITPHYTSVLIILPNAQHHTCYTIIKQINVLAQIKTTSLMANNVCTVISLNIGIMTLIVVKVAELMKIIILISRDALNVKKDLCMI